LKQNTKNTVHAIQILHTIFFCFTEQLTYNNTLMAMHQ